MWAAIVGESTEMFESVKRRASKIVIFAEVDESGFEELCRIAEMTGCVVVRSSEPRI